MSCVYVHIALGCDVWHHSSWHRLQRRNSWGNMKVQNGFYIYKRIYILYIWLALQLFFPRPFIATEPFFIFHHHRQQPRPCLGGRWTPTNVKITSLSLLCACNCTTTMHTNTQTEKQKNLCDTHTHTATNQKTNKCHLWQVSFSLCVNGVLVVLWLYLYIYGLIYIYIYIYIYAYIEIV